MPSKERLPRSRRPLAPVKPKMRILHVVPTYFPAVRYGGPIHSVHGLCAALAARGHDVNVFTTNVDGPGDSAVPLGSPVEMDGAKIWYFPSRHLRRLYWSPAMARALAPQVGSFDLVHLHSVFLWPTWAAARAARAAGVPYVLSPRGMLVRELFESRSGFAKNLWMALAERRNIALAAGIHVTSAVEAREFQRFGLRSDARVFEVPNGVEVTPSPERSGAPPPAYVLMLGRISWKKRIEMALEAVQHIDGIRLVVAGGDDEGLTGALRDRAVALGVADRTEFAGLVEGDRKARLLRDATALLMPSVSENFGNSVIEALAVGTPAIVTPEVGAAELLATSGGGFVVAASARAIADAIQALVDDPGLRARMGQCGLKAVEGGYSWPAVGARMEAQYHEILNGSPRRT